LLKTNGFKLMFVYYKLFSMCKVCSTHRDFPSPLNFREYYIIKNIILIIQIILNQYFVNVLLFFSNLVNLNNEIKPMI
jgi:hypothetical protein